MNFLFHFRCAVNIISKLLVLGARFTIIIKSFIISKVIKIESYLIKIYNRFVIQFFVISKAGG